MKILFISKYAWPHVGGVEKHIEKVKRLIESKGHKVKIISSDGNGDYRINYPKVKYLGLLKIWFEFFKLRKIILASDVIHVHDVFIWYLPFRFMYPHIKVYTTFHGWEGKYPIPLLNILQKKIAWKLSSKTIAVGDYINKYYGIESDAIIYGASDTNRLSKSKKIKNKSVFLGRLEQDTGLLKFLKHISITPLTDVTFVGDGSLRTLCERYGKVVGFTDPNPYLKSAEYCVPSGYLSYWEAKRMGCKIVTYSDNPLKVDYWKEVKELKNVPTWNLVANIYLKLWDN